jgi:hypothetical protein
MKKTLLAGIASSLVMFSLAGLYTGVLARSFIADHVDAAMLRQPANLALVFCGYLLLALLMAWLYPRLASPGRSTLRNGLLFGICSAVFWLMPYSLVLFGVYRFPYAALPLDFAWAVVEQGVGGTVIAFVYGKSATAR